ncbi:Proline/betaine transporter [Halomonadaceae bacterium LMG 33818]|uniref:MFS transporter n=1 Tax=Cernens ardua TaxID=3402176 RepID=UPI003EDC223D
MPTTAPSATPAHVSFREVFAVASGAAIEFFDFSAYATFSVMIGQVFFPSSSNAVSLLSSLAVFGLGFLARPLGAVIIGTYADTSGRKPAMLLTMLLMIIGTAGMALLPGYTTWGIWAPLLLLICRLLQGIAWGGEAGPATTFIMEAAPPHRRGLYTSWQIVAQGAAGLAAGLIGFALSRELSHTQLLAWGWRVPFLIGLLVLPVAIYLRRHLNETLPATADSTLTNHTSSATLEYPLPSAAQTPLSMVLKDYRALVIVGILIISGSTITQYFLNYMTTYALSELHYPTQIAMLAPIVIGVGVMLFSLLGGYLADHWGRSQTIIIPRVVLTLLLFPALILIGEYHAPWLFFVLISVLTALQCISGSGLLVALCESFPRPLRSTGFSIVYALGITLFGGTAQFVFSWLSDVMGTAIAPAYYLVVTNLVCMGATVWLYSGRGSKK